MGLLSRALALLPLPPLQALLQPQFRVLLYPPQVLEGVFLEALLPPLLVRLGPTGLGLVLAVGQALLPLLVV